MLDVFRDDLLLACLVISKQRPNLDCALTEDAGLVYDDQCAHFEVLG
jgi:hypothetical protein